MILPYLCFRGLRVGLSKIEELFSKLSLKRALHESGIKKEKGYTVLELLNYLLLIMMEKGSSINNGLVRLNLKKVKTPINDLISNEIYNWRNLLFKVAKRYTKLFPAISKEDSILIIDDTAKEKTGRKSDLISWFRDHCGNRFFKGYQNLTIAWSNGRIVIPLDFEMKIGKNSASKSKARNYLKKSHTNQRKRFAKQKKTELLIQMIKRVNQRKFEYKYILWDTWFNCSSTLNFIFSKVVPKGKTLISMLKNGNQKFKYRNKYYNLKELYKKLGNIKRIEKLKLNQNLSLLKY